jgi:uncharacterized protein
MSHSTQSLAENSLSHTCDLSVKLFRPDTIFTEEISPGKWVLFAPDYEGLPVVVSTDVYEVLTLFTGGRVASEVLAERCNFDKTCSDILFLEERGFLRSKPVRLPYPPPEDVNRVPSSFGVWLHIINKCNLDCSYCFVEHKAGEVMSDEVMEQAVDYLTYTSISTGIKKFDLKFAGGEPTLAIPKMERFHDMLSTKLEGTNTEFWTAVLSNGTVLNGRLLDFLKRPRTGIGISLDGYGNMHNTFRIFKGSGRGSWDIIEKNLCTLRNHGIKPYIMSTISQATSGGLTQFLLWIYENDLSTRLSVVRQPSRCRDCGDRNSSEGYEKLCEEMIAAFDDALATLTSHGFFINLPTSMEICELHFDKPADGVSCNIGLSHIVIKPNGKIVPCPMMVDEEGMIPSRNLLASCKKCFPFKQSERGQEPQEDECLSCKWFPVCAGGCAVTNLRVNGHPFTKSKLCAFYKFIIPRYVSFFGAKEVQAAQRKRPSAHNTNP